MAYSNSTPNYKLPVFENNDKANWYDINTGNNIIDTAMESNRQESEKANQKADTNTNAIAALNATVTTQGENINTSKQDISNLESTVALHTTHLNEIDVINTNQNTRITALENSSGETGTELVDIKKDIENITANVQTNSQNIANAETEIQSLQDITDTMQEDINKLSPQTTVVNLSVTSASPESAMPSTARIEYTSDGKWWIKEFVLNWASFGTQNSISYYCASLPDGLLGRNFIPVPVQIYGQSSDYAYNSVAVAGIGVEGSGARIEIFKFSTSMDSSSRSVSIKGFHN